MNNHLNQSNSTDSTDSTNLTNQSYTTDELNIIKQLDSLEQINSYKNIPLLLHIYANKNLWNIFCEKISKEYLNDPLYQQSVKSFSNYSNLWQINYKIYFKLTESAFKTKGFAYKLGLNIDTKKFKPYGCCSGGGLYFCELENIYQFVHFGKYLTPIIVPFNIPIYEENHGPHCISCGVDKNISYIKYKAPIIFTLPRIKIDNIDAIKLITSVSNKNNVFLTNNLYKSNDFNELWTFIKAPLISDKWHYQKYIANTKLKILTYIRDCDKINNIQNENDRMLYEHFELLVNDVCKIVAMYRCKLMINYLIDKGFADLFENKQPIQQNKSNQQNTSKKSILSKIFNKFTNMPTQHNQLSQHNQQNSTTNISQLSKLNLNCKEFLSQFTSHEISLFSNNNVVIAGSFVLRHLVGNTFSNNDIDIYINIDDFAKLQTEAKNFDIYFNKFRFNKLNNVSFTSNTTSFASTTTSFASTTNYNMTGIISICELNVIIGRKYIKSRKFHKPTHRKYQIIVVSGNPAEFIKSNFDFDLCTISFDFTKNAFINMITKPNYKILTIQKSYFQKMTGSEIDSYSNYRANKTIQRIKKYADRGFIIENWKEFLIEIRDKMCNH